MLKKVQAAWSVPELRSRILFVLFALLVFRFGAAVPVPYIDTDLLRQFFTAHAGALLGMINALSGSALSRATVFALSVQPYINASILIQLLTIAVPSLERLRKDGGEAGKKKIQAATRYTAAAVGLLQGSGYYALIRRSGFLSDTGLWAAAVIIFTLTAGSVFLMWLGEQITEHGIGNGISVLLFAGILSRMPYAVSSVLRAVRNYSSHLDTSGWTEAERAGYSVLHPGLACLLAAGILALVVFTVFMTLSERRVPVQYAGRTVGRKAAVGRKTYLPVKINLGGVLPVIFAQSVLAVPASAALFFPASRIDGTVWNRLAHFFDSAGAVYTVLYLLLIAAFSYFYAYLQFDPTETANALKRNGGSIPGFRPGRPTADVLAGILKRITFFGAGFLSAVALLPLVFGHITGITGLGIGGTSVIIVVGVALDTVRQAEARMLMRHYKGFLI